MGKAILKPGQKPVSGIYCGIQYKVNNRGEQLMFFLRRPSDEEVRKNPAARAERVIGDCVWEIQRRMHNEEEAMAQYRAIRERVKRDYKRCYVVLRDDRKIVEIIVNGYFLDNRHRPSKDKGCTGLTLDLTPI